MVIVFIRGETEVSVRACWYIVQHFFRYSGAAWIKSARWYNWRVKHVVKGIEDMNGVAAMFAEQLTPKEKGATIVTLSGSLGVGKTAFARALARAFGIDEDVTSPTYVIEKIYMPAKGVFSRFIHIDAYRLNGAHDLDVLGWRELIQESGNLIILEWPEKVDGAIPKDALKIELEFVDEQTRKIIW